MDSCKKGLKNDGIRSCEQVETIDIRPAPLVTIHAAGNHEHEDPEKRLKLVVLARPWCPCRKPPRP